MSGPVNSRGDVMTSLIRLGSRNTSRLGMVDVIAGIEIHEQGGFKTKQCCDQDREIK